MTKCKNKNCEDEDTKHFDRSIVYCNKCLRARNIRKRKIRKEKKKARAKLYNMKLSRSMEEVKANISASEKVYTEMLEKYEALGRKQSNLELRIKQMSS
jgi:hypothetical protein